jgi:hypothetical protein
MHIRFLIDAYGAKAGDTRTVTTEFAIDLIDKAIAEPSDDQVAADIEAAAKSIERVTGRRFEPRDFKGGSQ